MRVWKWSRTSSWDSSNLSVRGTWGRETYTVIARTFLGGAKWLVHSRREIGRSGRVEIATLGDSRGTIQAFCDRRLPMDIDGVEVVEEQEEYGFSWRWDDPRGFQSEILWNREVGYLNL